MKTFRLIIALLLTGLSFAGHAQQEKSSNINYALFIEGGICGGINHAAIEQVIFNGISINEKHVVGIGLGFGLGFAGIFTDNDVIYCPVYANYRYYFKTGDLAPHVNLSAGTMLLATNQAFYSTLTAGFRKHKFTFSSGIFLHAHQYTNHFIMDKTPTYPFSWTDGDKVYELPVGLIVRLGVAF
jgi:hypothetical protein